jgi:hypothetical protein
MNTVTFLHDSEPDPQEFLWSGRGQLIVAKALHYAIKYIGSLPEAEKPSSDRDDMLFILNNVFPEHADLLRHIDKRKLGRFCKPQSQRRMAAMMIIAR